MFILDSFILVCDNLHILFSPEFILDSSLACLLHITCMSLPKFVQLLLAFDYGFLSCTYDAPPVSKAWLHSVAAIL